MFQKVSDVTHNRPFFPGGIIVKNHVDVKREY
jgi:hypothetical protein